MWCVTAAPALRPSRHQRDIADDDDSDAEAGTRSSFARHAAVHRHPRHTPTTYGSTAGQSNEDRGPSVDAGESSLEAHVAARLQRVHRSRRGHIPQSQPNVEDV